MARARGTGADGTRGADEPVPTDPDSALRMLYAAHWGALVRLASLLLGSTSAAEEVVQEAFVGTYRRWHRLRDPQAAAGYLRSSVVNGCRSVHRHRVVEVRHRQPSEPPPVGPEELVERRAEDAGVMAVLATLPQRQREVLVLRYYLDASEAEIAELMDISRGAVKSHAHRGLASLRAGLEAAAGTAGGQP